MVRQAAFVRWGAPHDAPRACSAPRPAQTGGMSSFDHRGLIPRAVSYLFKQAQMDSERAVTVRVSYLEIYNEQLYDLLALPDSMEHGSELTIQEGSAGGSAVRRRVGVIALAQPALHLIRRNAREGLVTAGGRQRGGGAEPAV